MTEPEQPFLRVVSGNPTPDELAALTVLLATAGQPAEADDPAATTGWGDLSLRLRRLPAPGPGAWRSSAWS